MEWAESPNRSVAYTEHVPLMGLRDEGGPSVLSDLPLDGPSDVVARSSTVEFRDHREAHIQGFREMDPELFGPR